MSGNLENKTLDKILKGRRYNYFIETGTFRGTTTLPMAKRFKNVHTFELDRKLQAQVFSDARNQNLSNITFHLGDTEVIFAPVIKDIKEKCIFYLDAHKVWGGNKTFGSIGKRDVPLLSEIKAINDNRNFDDVIIADDYRLFDNRWFKEKNKEVRADWNGIHEDTILSLFNSKKVVNSYVFDDKYIINLRKI